MRVYQTYLPIILLIWLPTHRPTACSAAMRAVPVSVDHEGMSLRATNPSSMTLNMHLSVIWLFLRYLHMCIMVTVTVMVTVTAMFTVIGAKQTCQTRE